MPTPGSDQPPSTDPPTSDLPPLPTEPAPSSSTPDGISSQIRKLIEPLDDRRDRIGPYRVVKRLGGGGMGVVWLCSRDDGEIAGLVAIKLVRTVGSERETNAFLRRFEAERQILNSMNHPNIGRLLDAGHLPAPDGRPYLVMEYVEGEHIDEYCDRMELSIEQRVRLFQKVCDAVQHAHQNLVVHRDIKPSNILVDARGEPKLMDFGIAKILNVGLAGLTMATGEGRGPMTPEYASPEQVMGKPVGTASDVYALGVLLYQLLTGRKPYRLKSKAADAIARAIVEEEPEKPSTAVTQEDIRVGWDGSTSTVTADRLAKPREGTVNKLKRRLSGDIDNIVLMAMRKSPARRYASAAAFAEDLQRHLDGQPVKARGEGWGYVAGKMLVRNRMAAAAAAAVVLATSGAAAYSWSAWRGERAARAEAEVARTEAEGARTEAEKRYEQVRSLAAEFPAEVVKRIEKERGSTESVNLLATLSLQMLEKLASDHPDDPRLQADLANGYFQVANSLSGTRGPGKGDFGAALPMIRKCLEIRRALVKAHPGDALRVVQLASALNSEAELLTLLEQKSEARERLDEAVRLVEPIKDSDATAARKLGAVLLSRSDLLESMGEESAASADLQRSVDIRKRLYEGKKADPTFERDYTVALSRVALAAETRGDRSRAEAALRESLSVRERRRELEPNARTERDVAMAAQALGKFLLKTEDSSLADAEKYLAQHAQIVERLAEADPSNARAADDRLDAAINLATVSAERGDTKRAMELWRKASQHAKTLANNAPDDVSRRRVLARVLEQQSQAEDAAGEDSTATVRETLSAYKQLPQDAETVAQIRKLEEYLQQEPK